MLTSSTIIVFISWSLLDNGGPSGRGRLLSWNKSIQHVEVGQPTNQPNRFPSAPGPPMCAAGYGDYQRCSTKLSSCNQSWHAAANARRRRSAGWRTWITLQQKQGVRETRSTGSGRPASCWSVVYLSSSAILPHGVLSGGEWCACAHGSSSPFS